MEPWTVYLWIAGLTFVAVIFYLARSYDSGEVQPIRKIGLILLAIPCLAYWYARDGVRKIIGLPTLP